MSREHLDMIVRSPELLLQDVIVAKDPGGQHSQKAEDNSPLSFQSYGERSRDSDSMPSPRYSAQSGGREQKGYHSQDDSDDGGYQRGSGGIGGRYQGAYQSREAASQGRSVGGYRQSRDGVDGYQGSFESEGRSGYQRSPGSNQRGARLQDEHHERGQGGSRLQERGRDRGSYQGGLLSQGGIGGYVAREGGVGYPVGSRLQADSRSGYPGGSDSTPAQSQRFAVPQMQQMDRGSPSLQDGGSSERLSRSHHKFGQQGIRDELSHPLFQQQVL